MIARSPVIAAFAALAVFAVAASAQATSADVSTCKAVATALGINPAGNTLFCPTNEAFVELADDLNISPSQLMAVVKANPAVFKTILSFHAVKGIVPSSALKTGRTPVATLLGSGKNGLTVVKDRKGEVEVEFLGLEFDRDEEDAVETHSADVEGVDLTFDGKYTPGKSTYIVHAVDEVLIPESAMAGLGKLSGVAGRKLRLL